MEEWLSRLVDRLNQQPEPDDIIEAELQFIRLCVIDCPERVRAFDAIFGDLILDLIGVAIRVHATLPRRRTVTAAERSCWRAELERDFYAELKSMQDDWANEFGMIEQLVSLFGTNPLDHRWRQHFSRTSDDRRRSLYSLVEEYADQWLRKQFLNR